MPDYLLMTYSARYGTRITFEVCIVDGGTVEDAERATRTFLRHQHRYREHESGRQPTRVIEPLPERFLYQPSLMGEDTLTREMDAWAEDNPNRISQPVGSRIQIIVQQKVRTAEERYRAGGAATRAIERRLAPLAAGHHLRRPRRR